MRLINNYHAFSNKTRLRIMLANRIFDCYLATKDRNIILIRAKL